MRSVSTITPKHLELLQFTPLRHMAPQSAMVYENESVCIARTGPLLFFGGQADGDALSYLRDKILTFEIYEKYGVFYFFYPDEDWRQRLTSLYPGKTAQYQQDESAGPELLGPESAPIARILNEADSPALRVDLREMNRGGRAPEERAVKGILQTLLPGVEAVKRVPQGVSTYVYRAACGEKTYYARFLPEKSSFAAEVLAHKAAREKGVSVPEIIAFEEKEPVTGLSMMLAEEIPGTSAGDCPPENPQAVFYEAGRQLALLHTVPVEGFGWIDRAETLRLKGEKSTFEAYFTEYLHDDLAALEHSGFTAEELTALRFYMGRALEALDLEEAVLVHGDMDINHIFHAKGRFTGFIDLGEIRGCHPYYDLAAFSLFCGGKDYLELCEGYRSVHALDAQGLDAVELMALFIALRFAGKKFEADSGPYWRGVLRKQLKKAGELPRLK